MKMQLERTPQEKTVMAFNKAQQLIEKIQEIKNFMNMLEVHQSDLEFIAESIMKYRINTQIGRDAVKSISMDIDQLEIQLMNLLDQCQGEIESFNHWIKQCASLSYFGGFDGASALKRQVNEIHARINSIMR